MRAKVDQYLAYLLAFLLMAMTIDVLWGVFTRYILDNQSSWTEELARFLLIWIGVLGAAFAAGRNMHLAIDILPGQLEGSQQKWLAIGIHVLVILFVFGVLVIGGSYYTYLTYLLGQISSALRIPMAWIYGVIPVSGVLIIYYKLDAIYSALSS